MAAKTIGILALQGNFSMHAQAIAQAGAKAILLKIPTELTQIDGLILPGGESTTMLKHFEYTPTWWTALATFHAQAKPIFGTCAGLILLAKTVIPNQKSLGFLNISVERNGYGRQIHSHTLLAEVSLGDKKTQLSLSLIRAPRITEVGEGVKIIGKIGKEVIMVEQGQVLGASCHPEATTSLVHEYFISRCA